MTSYAINDDTADCTFLPCPDSQSALVMTSVLIVQTI